MTNIQHEVTNFIDQDVSVRRGLSREYINTRALARYIHKQLALPGSLDAVISSIRRYEPGKEHHRNIKKRYELIAAAKVSSRSRMVSCLLKKEAEVREGITRLYGLVDFSKGDVLRILEVSQFIKVILDQSNVHHVDSSFDDILEKESRLGEISILYADEVVETPGVFAALASELALHEISIRDGVICGNEHIFIVNEDELMKALHVLHGISKWGEKHI